MMTLSDEELKYIEALQPVFKKALGARKQLDEWLYCKERKEILSYMRCLRCPHCSGGEMDANLLRAPLPIDPQNPRRGVMNMISGLQWWVVRGLDSLSAHTDNTPYLALLKKLAAQEGMTIRKSKKQVPTPPSKLYIRVTRKGKGRYPHTMLSSEGWRTLGDVWKSIQDMLNDYTLRDRDFFYECRLLTEAEVKEQKVTAAGKGGG